MRPLPERLNVWCSTRLPHGSLLGSALGHSALGRAYLDAKCMQVAKCTGSLHLGTWMRIHNCSKMLFKMTLKICLILKPALALQKRNSNQSPNLLSVEEEPLCAKLVRDATGASEETWETYSCPTVPFRSHLKGQSD